MIDSDLMGSTRLRSPEGTCTAKQPVLYARNLIERMRQAAEARTNMNPSCDSMLSGAADEAIIETMLVASIFDNNGAHIKSSCGLPESGSNNESGGTRVTTQKGAGFGLDLPSSLQEHGEPDTQNYFDSLVRQKQKPTVKVTDQKNLLQVFARATDTNSAIDQFIHAFQQQFGFGKLSQMLS